MNRLSISALLLLGVLTGHAKNKPSLSNKYTITHFNIIFAPDLSNRMNPALYKRPLRDANLLELLAGDLYPTILRCKRSENQKDKLTVDFINKGLVSEYAVSTDKLLIDFGCFTKQNDRISYIMARPGAKRTMGQDIKAMLNEFNRISNIAAKQNFGADIWTYLNEGIDEKKVLRTEPPIMDDGNTYTNTYRNILILPTDGYIEAGIFDKGFDLSKKKVDRFRDAYLASGETNIHQFFKKNKQFRIRPVQNEHLKQLEILVVELYDRSRGKGGQATVQPTDMEIIKLFWSDWLKASGVKRFELQPYANSKDEAEKIILNFLGVPKLPEIK